eukprot:2786491-Rhodomonas_salina.1
MTFPFQCVTGFGHLAAVCSLGADGRCAAKSNAKLCDARTRVATACPRPSLVLTCAMGVWQWSIYTAACTHAGGGCCTGIVAYLPSAAGTDQRVCWYQELRASTEGQRSPTRGVSHAGGLPRHVIVGLCQRVARCRVDPPGIVLRGPYAKSGTDRAYGQLLPSALATRYSVLTLSMVLPQTIAILRTFATIPTLLAMLLATLLATLFFVLTWRMVLRQGRDAIVGAALSAVTGPA